MRDAKGDIAVALLARGLRIKTSYDYPDALPQTFVTEIGPPDAFSMQTGLARHLLEISYAVLYGVPSIRQSGCCMFTTFDGIVHREGNTKPETIAKYRLDHSSLFQLQRNLENGLLSFESTLVLTKS